MKTTLVALFCTAACLFCLLVAVLGFNAGRHGHAFFNLFLAAVNGVCAFLNFRLARRA